MMRDTNLGSASRAISLVTLILLTGIASAHHSPARFSDDQIVAVFGTVVDFDWKNPHVYLVVEDENNLEWQFETNATSNLSRNGWSRDSFATGDKVSVRAYANRDPAKTHAMLISAVDPDGKSFSARVARPEPIDQSTDNLNGIWRGDPKIAFEFLFGMIDHPITDKGAAARAVYDESMDPIADCVTWPSPRLVAWSAFYFVELEITESVVFFRSEFDHLEREIHVDGRPHPENGERTSQGHSIGRWEGKTLVVDTVDFADSISPVADGIPSGAGKHVIERYTLSEDGTRADVEIWVEDPEYLAEPFSAKLVWHYSPHLEMLGFECDPATSKRFVQ
jgi:hypothetical protein